MHTASLKNCAAAAIFCPLLGQLLCAKHARDLHTEEMESQRTFTSRMDTMSRKHFSLVFGGLVIYMAICVLIGALGPVATLTTALGGAATISLLDPGQTCTKLPTNTSAVKPRCWEYVSKMGEGWGRGGVGEKTKASDACDAQPSSQEMAHGDLRVTAGAIN